MNFKTHLNTQRQFPVPADIEELTGTHRYFAGGDNVVKGVSSLPSVTSSFSSAVTETKSKNNFCTSICTSCGKQIDFNSNLKHKHTTFEDNTEIIDTSSGNIKASIAIASKNENNFTDTDTISSLASASTSTRTTIVEDSVNASARLRVSQSQSCCKKPHINTARDNSSCESCISQDQDQPVLLGNSNSASSSRIYPGSIPNNDKGHISNSDCMHCLPQLRWRSRSLETFEVAISDSSEKSINSEVAATTVISTKNVNEITDNHSDSKFFELEANADVITETEADADEDNDGSDSKQSNVDEKLITTTTSTSRSRSAIEIEIGNQNENEFLNEGENSQRDNNNYNISHSQWNLDIALENMNDITELYRDKLEWVDQNIKCGLNVQGKIRVLELWIEDLREQNEALVKIIRDIDASNQNKIKKYRTTMLQLVQRCQVQESMIKSFQAEVVRLRIKSLQLEEENELIKKSSLAWETSNRIVHDKMKQSDNEIEKLVLLLCRIRDDSKWDLKGIHLLPEIHSQIFGNYPYLPNSVIPSPQVDGDSDYCHSRSPHLSASHASFLFQEKCAELEAAKEELEKFAIQESTKEEILQNKLKHFEDLERKLLEANLQIKQYHNKLEELKGKIRVYCRIRPSNKNTRCSADTFDAGNRTKSSDSGSARVITLHFAEGSPPLAPPVSGSTLNSSKLCSTDSDSDCVVKFVDEFTVGVETVSCTSAISASMNANLDLNPNPGTYANINAKKDKMLKEFQFDRIFHPSISQEEIFNETKSLIQSAFDGFNVCIAAYGQTGSGKTHTILGDDRDPGLAPRTCTQLFSIASRSKHLYTTTISFYLIELYNQKLIDLLAATTRSQSQSQSQFQSPCQSQSQNQTQSQNHNQPKNQNQSQTQTTSSSNSCVVASVSSTSAGTGTGPGLVGTGRGAIAATGEDIQESGMGGNGNGSGNGRASKAKSKLAGAEGDKLEIRRDVNGTVFVQGARVMVVEDSATLLKALEAALQLRHTNQTQMNDSSSRSHFIIGINIENTCRLNGNVTRGKISLVDLAGSERQRRISSSMNTVLQESKHINKSLSALEHVIVSLTTGQGHVPYRNNKLTELMQDSIGGNAKTLFIVNVSRLKSNLDETIVSLNYGARIKNVVNEAVRNSHSHFQSNSNSQTQEQSEQRNSAFRPVVIGGSNCSKSR